jgi:hypothetical protein
LTFLHLLSETSLKSAAFTPSKMVWTAARS